ncbi:acyl-CoA dehydrogenase family protein [Nocardia miyunensis]|uniref:acyl-CoA dehydrogenase family protein n=1 Tax=Nocardia miyunensis TaxID=282684 RepID=UPI00082D0B13|nr:acyl-CoA dehydrogenase family protein [Nocardia miyunensis]
MSLWGRTLPAELAPVIEVLDQVAEIDDRPLPDLDDAQSHSLRAQLGRLGLWTVGSDELLGGGGDPVAAAAVVRRLAHRSAGLAWGAVQAHAAIGLLGRNPRWTRLLDDIHTGTVGVAVTSFGVTAHDSPASAQSGVTFDVATPAEPALARFERIDGCGTEPWVLALDGENTAWVIPPESIDFDTVRRTGFCGTGTGRATLRQALSTDNLLGDVDVEATTTLRLGAAAIAVGLAEAGVAAAWRYCRARTQFGAPLTDLVAVRESLYRNARDAGLLDVTSLDPRGVDVRRAAALADAACEAAVDVTAGAIQMHGGYGYLVEYGVERLFRDAVSLRAAIDIPATRRQTARALVAG